MSGLGLLFAFYAYAQSNLPGNIGVKETPFSYTAWFSYDEILFKPNFPDAEERVLEYKLANQTIKTVKHENYWTWLFFQKPETIQNLWGGQCVVFARNYLRIPATSAFGGYAGRIRPNSDSPAVLGVVLTQTHAAVIADIQGDELILIESNYHGDEKIDYGRRLNVNDPSIRGYFNY